MNHIITIICILLLSISSFAQNNYPFYKDGLYGYKNADGNVILPANYTNVKPSNENIFIIQKDLPTGLKWGAIDKNNKTLIPFNYDNLTYVSENAILGSFDKSSALYNTKGEMLAQYKDGKWEILKVDKSITALINTPLDSNNDYRNVRWNSSYFYYPNNEIFTEIGEKKIHQDSDRYLGQVNTIYLLKNDEEGYFRIFNDRSKLLVNTRIPLYYRCNNWDLPTDQWVFYSDTRMLNPSFPNKLKNMVFNDIDISDHKEILISAETDTGFIYYDNYLNQLYSSKESMKCIKKQSLLITEYDHKATVISLKSGQKISFDGSNVKQVEIINNGILLYQSNDDETIDVNIWQEKDGQLVLSKSVPESKVKQISMFDRNQAYAFAEDSIYWNDPINQKWETISPKKWLKNERLSAKEMLLLDMWNPNEALALSIIDRNLPYYIFRIPNKEIAYVFNADKQFVSTVDLNNWSQHIFINFNHTAIMSLDRDKVNEFPLRKFISLNDLVAQSSNNYTIEEVGDKLAYEYTSNAKIGLKDAVTQKIIIKAKYDEFKLTDSFKEYIAVGRIDEQWELVGLPPYENIQIAEAERYYFTSFLVDIEMFGKRKAYDFNDYKLIIEDIHAELIRGNHNSKYIIPEYFKIKPLEFTDDKGNVHTTIFSSDYKTLQENVENCVARYFPYPHIEGISNGYFFYIPSLTTTE